MEIEAKEGDGSGKMVMILLSIIVFVLLILVVVAIILIKGNSSGYDGESKSIHSCNENIKLSKECYAFFSSNLNTLDCNVDEKSDNCFYNKASVSGDQIYCTHILDSSLRFNCSGRYVNNVGSPYE